MVVKSVNVPGEVSLTGTSLVSAYFLNASDKDMFNTELVITGEIAGGEKTASLGTVSAKRNAYGETYVSFESVGNKVINLSIRYEDANGENHEETIGQYQLSVSDTSSVNTSVTSVSTSDSINNNNNGAIGNMSMATLLLIASGVIVLIIIVVVIINVTRKRK